MRMRSCPKCGTPNSTKRTICYQCRASLRPESPNIAPSSRWEALETHAHGEAGAAPHKTPDVSSAREVQGPAVPPKASRRGILAVRHPISHVRRMGLFFRELHTLTRSGVAIAPACRELERHAPSSLRFLAREMASVAESGEPTSTVMETHQNLFYPWHVGVVRAAETGGFLPEAFDQIAHAYEVEWETRTALRLRLFFYGVFGTPAVLFSLPLILTVAQPIPAEGWTPESVAGTIFYYFRTISLPIAVGLFACIVIWQMLQTTAWFQEAQQRIVLRLPIVGRMARAAALQRYMAILGLMLRGGLPIAGAAEEAAMSAGNVVLTPKLLEIVPTLREGVPLSQLLRQTEAFDPDTLNMATTGEMSGSLPEMLERAAGYYREENEAKRKMLLKVAGVTFGVIWLALLGALALVALRTYFDFAFRTYDWMMEGIE